MHPLAKVMAITPLVCGAISSIVSLRLKPQTTMSFYGVPIPAPFASVCAPFIVGAIIGPYLLITSPYWIKPILIDGKNFSINGGKFTFHDRESEE